MIDPDKLYELGFIVDTEQERAVLPLTQDKDIKLVVDGDAQINLNWDGMTCKLNTEEFDEENIIEALKTLFKGQQTLPPF